MGTDTRIAWCDHTWNPWVGCTKVSAGCANCYMYREQRRFGRDPEQVTRTSPATFRLPLRRSVEAGSRVFVCSWSDFFHAEADAFRNDAWAIMRQRPDVTFLLLTKRPERIGACLPSDWGRGWPNVIGMVTAENQAMADLRIPYLLEAPFAKRGVSVEPMLWPVDLIPWLWEEEESDYSKYRPRLDWVICGGESGTKARPMNPDWARSLRDQCASAGVPFFFKQWGEWLPLLGRVGKHRAGDMLDGCQHHEWPGEDRE